MVELVYDEYLRKRNEGFKQTRIDQRGKKRKREKGAQDSAKSDSTVAWWNAEEQMTRAVDSTIGTTNTHTHTVARVHGEFRFELTQCISRQCPMNQLKSRQKLSQLLSDTMWRFCFVIGRTRIVKWLDEQNLVREYISESVRFLLRICIISFFSSNHITMLVRPMTK